MSASLLDSLLQQPEFCRKSRLPSLYADFSQLSQSNKDGYDANMQAWLDALDKAIYDCPSSTEVLCISANSDLSAQLGSSQYGRPLALPAIEEEARRKRQWIPVSAFLAFEEPLYAVPSLFANLTLGSALRWGFSKVVASSPATKLSGTRYVSVPNLERIVDSISSLWKDLGGSYSDYISTQDMCKDRIETLTGKKLSQEEFKILLKFLSRDKGVLSCSSTTVKFKYDGKECSEIDASDEAIAQLQTTINKLKRTVTELVEQETRLDGLLKQYIRHDKKELAKSTLRSSKRVKTQLSETLDREAQVSVLLERINQGMSQVELVKGFKLGSQVLSHVLSQIGGVQAVEDVIERVEQQSQEVQDVAAAININSTIKAEEEEEDVESEYQALLQQSAPVPVQKPEKVIEQEFIDTNTKHEEEKQESEVIEERRAILAS